ncbi:MAG: chromophore lyase CpcT/CpeT [Thermoanaerobaculia bacterium]
MNARGITAAVCLLLVRPAGAAEGRAAEVAGWSTGTFETAESTVGAPEAGRIVIVAVPKSRIANGAFVLYREQAAIPKLDEPTQQRFLVIEDERDAVRIRVFEPKDPLIVRGKWRNPSTLALYGADDLREKRGCVMLLKKSADRWEGGTQGTSCPSTNGAAATMTSTLLLSRDGFTEWDRGFDEKGLQTWGPTEGGTRFVKKSNEAPADDRFTERPLGRAKRD